MSRREQVSTSLAHLLQQHASAQPAQAAALFLDRGAVVDEIPSFADLDRSARVVASALGEHLGTGDRALLLYPPGLDFIRAFFGCLYAGVIAVPASLPKPRGSMSRVEAMAADAGARVILTSGETLDRLDRLFVCGPDFRFLSWIATDRIGPGSRDTTPIAAIGRDSVAFLQYTSGTTSQPKGVVVTHANILAQCEQIHLAWRFGSNETFVSWLPHYHDMGLIGLLASIYHGARSVLLSPLAFYQNPGRWLRAISDYRAGCSAAPNSAYELCVSRVTDEEMATLDLSGWIVAINGAEPVRYPTLERFAERFARCGFRREALCPSYGLAEATLGVTTSGSDTAPVQDRSVAGCGGPLRDQRVAIVDPETRTLRPDGDVGEIWIAGPNVAQGYWNKPDETAATFHAHLADGSDGPFLRTGDIGYLKNGELFVAGRIKDLIIVGGRNHYPQDIELTVERCHPSLRPFSGAAFAVEVADEEQLVVVHEVERTSLASDLTEIVAAIRRAVTAEHDIGVHAVELVKPGAIPRTSSGKIQRHVCREGFLAGRLSLVSQGAAE